jgi:hypothetical protein
MDQIQQIQNPQSKTNGFSTQEFATKISTSNLSFYILNLGLKFWWQILEPTNHRFTLRFWNPLILSHPNPRFLVMGENIKNWRRYLILGQNSNIFSHF